VSTAVSTAASALFRPQRIAPSARLTRRGFLCQAVVAGGALALNAAGRAATPASAGSPGAGRVAAAGAPVTIITLPVSTDANPRARAWNYLGEILNRAGVFHDSLPAARLEQLAPPNRTVVILPGHLPLSAAQRGALTAWVRAGGSLLGLGGTSGLDEVFGVQGGSPLADGWLKVTAGDHPVTAGLRSSLHVFGGYAVKPGAAIVLAEVETANRAVRGGAVLENRFGRGRAVLFGPDLIFSVVQIQQGLTVLQDGRPAPDESAALNDGVLKAEDGMVLDWQRDRQPAAPDGGRIFLEPVSDELRELILRGVLHLAREADLRLPLLWYWPGATKAVGMISHDTDGHDPKKGVALLAAMNRCGIKSTWCTLYPGGYPGSFYRELQDQGFEIALHYDAMSGGAETSWSKENFLRQHRWLLKEAGLRHITSNKNHYTRWEGRLDFLRWCEEAGIDSDGTRGPSKKGTIGFPLGGSQPYFPLDDEAATPRLLKVLEVNLLTQDPVVTQPLPQKACYPWPAVLGAEVNLLNPGSGQARQAGPSLRPDSTTASTIISHWNLPLRLERKVLVGCIDADVTEPVGNRAEIDSGAQQVDGRAMPHAVGMEALVSQGQEFGGCFEAVLVEDPAYPEARQRLAAVIAKNADRLVRSYALFASSAASRSRRHPPSVRATFVDSIGCERRQARGSAAESSSTMATRHCLSASNCSPCQSPNFGPRENNHRHILGPTENHVVLPLVQRRRASLTGMLESIAIRQLWPVGPAVISAADVLVKIADAPPVSQRTHPRAVARPWSAASGLLIRTCRLDYNTPSRNRRVTSMAHPRRIALIPDPWLVSHNVRIDICPLPDDGAAWPKQTSLLPGCTAKSGRRLFRAKLGLRPECCCEDCSVANRSGYRIQDPCQRSGRTFTNCGSPTRRKRGGSFTT
jgi:hypothetical protein